MKNLRKILLLCGIIVILVGIFLLVSFQITKNTGLVVETGLNNDCIINKHVKMYISSDNPNEELKNIKLTNYLSYFDIVNCKRNPELCIKEGINSFPTLSVEDKTTKDISVKGLSDISGCELN